MFTQQKNDGYLIGSRFVYGWSECIVAVFLTSCLLHFPGATARVRRGFSSSTLPTGEPHQAAPGVQPVTGAAKH